VKARRFAARRLAALLALPFGLAFPGCGDGAVAGLGTDRRTVSIAPRVSPAVPILLYHHLGDPPPGERHASLWVTPRRFRAQLDALDRAGFHAVTLARVWDAWHGGRPLPKRPVVLTFDDGYAEQDAIARPALARHGWRGVLNLQLNHINIRGGLSRAAVRRLVAAGWEVDDHSATHPDLTKVSPKRLHAEVTTSRATFRRTLGIDPMFFSYPYGKVDARVRAAVRDAGFLAATTIVPRRATSADDPFLLPRLIARRDATPAQLVRLAGRGRR
jgi:peptidoglycan/xylan/chitin deacetylase (PgdA/CDA1 family)